MSVRSLLRNGLTALVMSSMSISALPEVSHAKPKQEISLVGSKEEEKIEALLENSEYIADPVFMADDTDFELITDSNSNYGL